MKEFLIQDIGIEFGDAPFGSSLKSIDYTDQGIPVIQGRNIKNNKFEWNQKLYVSEAKFSSLKRSHCREGDLVFPKVGTIGITAIAKAIEGHSTFLLSTNMMKMSVNIKLADIQYVYYYFCQPQVKDTIVSNAGGTSQPIFNFTTLKKFKIKLPALPAQRKVVSILSAYDDLIDNNRKRIALLEKAARLLYEEWFVRLQFPGHEHTPVVAGVPQGWESGTVGSFFNTASGGTPSRAKEAYYTGSYNWVKTKELNNNFIFDTEEKITEEAIKDSAAKLFPKETILVAMYGATVGELGILGVKSATNQACCAILPTEGISYTYTYLFFLTQKEKLISLSMGAAQKNVSQQIIRSMPIVLPKKGILNAFSTIVEPLFEQLRVLQIQTQKLQAARDLLLPRLMSGELAV